MRYDAIVLRDNDVVATALRDIRAAERVVVADPEGTRRIEVREDVAYGHKFAVRDIRRGEPVTKYGEVIGRATRDIPSGAHAHVHNIESNRGRGDWDSTETAGGV